MGNNSLWGEDFNISSPSSTKELVKKSKAKKTVKTVEQVVKSKSTSIEDKLSLINAEVNRILGVYKENTLVIKSREELHRYIDSAIKNGVIAIDTETNNSLDPLTCKIMGGCIYTPNEKNAYIPINHINRFTNERLGWQCTENDFKEELERLKENNVLNIFHNGKFDYEVIKCTCDCDLDIYWDTMIGAKVLDENERAGLKQQYIEKIDPSIEKYSIDHLFTVPYEVVDPEVFALYAATDSMMTYKLYEYQKNIFEQEENKRLYSLFKDIEMKVIKVVADMELTGVCLDLEYSKRLSAKYHRQLDDLQKKINDELSKYEEIIDKWKLTSEANYHPEKNGKKTKSKAEQLDNPISLTSNTQLAILLYDILKVGIIDAKSPRGVGVDILNKIDLPLCKLILEQRGLDKLIGTYIDKLPECLSERDGRLHASFNQYGADTGRFSSNNPNLNLWAYM